MIIRSICYFKMRGGRRATKGDKKEGRVQRCEGNEREQW